MVLIVLDRWGPNLQSRHCSTPPSRSEQETKAGHDGEGGVRPLLERNVNRPDKIVGHVAHRTNRVASFVLSVGNDTVDARLGAPPSGVAFVGENLADLFHKLREIVTQGLKIVLDV